MIKNITEQVNITLSNNINIGQDDIIHPETTQKINKIINHAQKEAIALAKTRISDEAVTACYHILFIRTNTKVRTPKQELLSIANTKNAPLLIYKINKLIKDRGNLYILKKSKTKIETTYCFEILHT
jgi:propanediol dehydratase small subunit